MPQAATLPLRPGVSVADRRVPADLAQPPLRSLVRVQTELGARCTGFLIAPAVVMTAAHCLYLPRVGRFVQPDSVHVLVGYRAGRFRAHARAVRLVVPPGYDPRNEPATTGLDRAVLVLERPVAAGSDVAHLAPVPPSAPAEIRLVGYGQDREEVPVGDPSCRLTGTARDGGGRGLLLHDCEATRGTSGAPLFWRAPDGQWQVIGLQVEARALAGGVAAIVPDTSGGR